MMERRVVITGGANGIGLNLTQRFLQLGDRVAICDCDPLAVEHVTKDLKGVTAIVADVADPDQMAHFHGCVERDLGGVDIMLANAGSAGPVGPIDILGFDEWSSCVGVNLFGAFNSVKWAAKHMKTQRHGTIIFTSSTSGLFGVPNRTPYVAAKWGLIGLTKSLAMELGDYNIRVNAICPGAVEGPRMEHVLDMESASNAKSRDEIRAIYESGVSLRRFVNPNDIVNMVEFLSSDLAENISGQAIAIDGHTERMT